MIMEIMMRILVMIQILMISPDGWMMMMMITVIMSTMVVKLIMIVLDDNEITMDVVKNLSSVRVFLSGCCQGLQYWDRESSRTWSILRHKHRHLYTQIPVGQQVVSQTRLHSATLGQQLGQFTFITLIICRLLYLVDGELAC